MAIEIKRDIPQGRGAEDPTFAPSVGLSTPGLANRPEVDKFTQLKQVLFGAVSDLASGLRAAGAAQAALDNKKEEVVRQQNRELAEVQQVQEAELKTEINQRYDRNVQKRQALILDSRSENPEFVLKNAEINYNNAVTAQEKELWFQLMSAAQSQQRQDREQEQRSAERQKIEDINLAGLTASQVIAEMGSNLQTDLDTQTELIGDGTGIHTRVQNWVLSQVAETAPELLVLKPDATQEEKNARDKMMAQLIQRALPIGDDLVRQYTKQTEQANESLAVNRVDALLYGIQTGSTVDMDVAKKTLTDISRSQMAHVPPAEQRQIQLKMAERAVEEASNLVHTQDFRVAGQAVENIIAVSDLPPAEANRLRQEAQRNLVKNASAAYSRDLGNKQAEMTKFAPWTPGTTAELQRVPDPEAPLKMAIPNEDGISGYRASALETLRSMGIDPNATDLTLTQGVIREQIMGQATALEAGALKELGKVDKKQVSAERAANPKLAGGDPNDLYDLSVTTVQASEDPNWNSVENQARRGEMYRSDAVGWSQVSDKFNLPTKLVDDKRLEWSSNDPQKMWNTFSFYRGLGYSERKRFLQQLGSGQNGLAVATSLREAANEVLKSGQGDWETAVQGAMQVMSNWSDLKRSDLDAAVLDSQGNITTTTIDGRTFPIRKNQDAAFRIMQAITLPLKEKDAAGNEQYIVRGHELVQTPSMVQAGDNQLKALTANMSDLEYDSMQMLYQGYLKQGKSPDEAGAATATYIASEGYSIIDLGNKVPKFVYDPKGVLGPNGMDQEAYSADIQNWATLPLSPEDRVIYAAKMKEINPNFDEKGEYLTITDYIRAAYPDGRYNNPDVIDEEGFFEKRFNAVKATGAYALGGLVGLAAEQLLSSDTPKRNPGLDLSLAFDSPLWDGVQDNTPSGGAVLYVRNASGGRDLLTDKNGRPLLVYNHKQTLDSRAETALKAAGF